MECVVRQELMKMLDWYFGMQTDFKINPGKIGSRYAEHLAPEHLQSLEHTYAGLGIDENWDSLFAMGTLFRRTAQEIADHFGFQYPRHDDEKVTAHLEHVRRLPPVATEIY
jgi:aminoglycoside 6-adenylyltransferase